MFRSCDDKVDLWLVDEADGALTQLLTEDPSTRFYVEAYGERGPVPEALTAAKGQAGAFTLEQLLKKVREVLGAGRGARGRIAAAKE